MERVGYEFVSKFRHLFTVSAGSCECVFVSVCVCVIEQSREQVDFCLPQFICKRSATRHVHNGCSLCTVQEEEFVKSNTRFAAACVPTEAVVQLREVGRGAAGVVWLGHVRHACATLPVRAVRLR